MTNGHDLEQKNDVSPRSERTQNIKEKGPQYMRGLYPQIPNVN